MTTRTPSKRAYSSGMAAKVRGKKRSSAMGGLGVRQAFERDGGQTPPTDGLGAAFGQSAHDEGQRDGGLGAHGHKAGLRSDLAPGLGLLEGAAGEAAPIGLVHRDLHPVAGAGLLPLEDVAGHRRL